MKLILKDKKQEAGDVISFIFAPEKPLNWQAGQYMHYVLSDPKADQRKEDRYFTIASAPHEQFIQLTTRFTPQGSTFKKDLHQLKIGDHIEADPPKGDFIVNDHHQEFIFIAGGIGITPYRSILLDLDRRNQLINVTLMYANRTPQFVFKEEFERLASKHQNFKIKYFIDPLIIDETIIGQIVPDLKKPIFYVSGPEPMVKAFEKMLIEMGIPDEHIKRDFFPGYSWP